MATEKGVPWWAKTIVYVALPIGVLVLVYKLITDWLMGPVNAVKDMWKQQYEDFVDELVRYSEEDEGNLTPEHQTILYGDENGGGKAGLIQTTQRTLVQILGDYMGVIEFLIVVVFGVAALYYAPAIISKWKGLVKKGDAQTGIGQGYIAACMLADDLAAKGYPTQATALVTTMQNHFSIVATPFMQGQISYWQSQLPYLTGWQLIYAQFVIQAYTIELATIPIWFTYLPPPILAGAVKA